MPGLAVALLLASSVSAATVPGTVANDYRNSPPWRDYLDWERVVISPRASAAGDSLRAHGVEVYYWLQPFLATWQGQPVTDYAYDRVRWEVSENYSAVLECSDVVNGKTCDFRVQGYPEAFAAAVSSVLPPADGLLYDYGCTSVSWLPSCRALGIDWQAWGSGYYRYRRDMYDATLEIPAVAQCSGWTSWIPQVSDGICLERVGAGLTTYQQAWTLLQGKPKSILFCEQTSTSTPQRRRCLATMAMVAGCGFNYMGSGPYQSVNLRDLEHFDLQLGQPGSSIIVIWDRGVYLRPYSRGWALLNLSPVTYSYQNYRVAPNDGLVVQTRDERGRWIPPRTNVGR